MRYTQGQLALYGARAGLRDELRIVGAAFVLMAERGVSADADDVSNIRAYLRSVNDALENLEAALSVISDEAWKAAK